MRTLRRFSFALLALGLASQASFAQTYGQPYGQTYGQPYGQTYAQPYGQTYGQTYGQPYGQTYGQPYGQTYGQPYRQTYGQASMQPSYGAQAGMAVPMSASTPFTPYIPPIRTAGMEEAAKVPFPANYQAASLNAATAPMNTYLNPGSAASPSTPTPGSRNAHTPPANVFATSVPGADTSAPIHSISKAPESADSSAGPEEITSPPTPAAAAQAPMAPLASYAPEVGHPVGPAAHEDHEDDGPCFGVWAEGLYLKARGMDIIFAQPRDGFTSLSVPRGPQSILQPDYSPGARAGLDYYINNCSAIEASFLWWEDQTHAFAAAPTGAVLLPTLTLPGIQNSAANSATATASSSLELRTAEVVYKHLLCGEPCHSRLDWFAGARYAHLREDLHTEFSIQGTTNVDTQINFEGAGPRVGLEGEVLCGCGLRMYGRASADFLAGHFGASFNQQNVFVGNQGNIDFKSDRVVPVLELELGLGWASANGRVRVSGGYSVAGWFNAVTTPDFIDAVRANNFTNNGENLKSTFTLDGVNARLELRF